MISIFMYVFYYHDICYFIFVYLCVMLDVVACWHHGVLKDRHTLNFSVE